MKKLILILTLIFSGCALKKVFNKDPIYEQALKHTQRCQIVNSFETKALIDIVYLNPIYPSKFKKTTFLVGVYNNFDNTLNNIEFNLTINNKTPSISTSIPNYILYKNFPFYNSWMSYYIVTTDTNPPFNIIYKSKHWGECIIPIEN